MVNWNKMETEAKKDFDRKQATIIRFAEPGDSFEGVLDEVFEYEDKSNGEMKEGVKFFSIDELSDEKFILFPSAALKGKFVDVEPGKAVKIVYIGDKQSQRNPMYKYKDFEIFLADI